MPALPNWPDQYDPRRPPAAEFLAAYELTGLHPRRGTLRTFETYSDGTSTQYGCAIGALILVRSMIRQNRESRPGSPAEYPVNEDFRAGVQQGFDGMPIKHLGLTTEYYGERRDFLAGFWIGWEVATAMGVVKLARQDDSLEG